MTELILTLDELRALRRTVGLALPGFVTDDDVPEVRVDVAALRGLAARGLVELTADPGDVLLSERLADCLAPCATSSLTVELDLEYAGELVRCAALGEPPAADGGLSAGGLVMTRRVGGLVALEPEGARVAEWVARRCGVEGLAASPTGEGFSVDAEAHAEADELALAGDPAGAVQVLGDAGAPMGAAQGWITALCRRRAAAAVTVAHGGTPLGELRWLVGADGTAWWVRDEAAAASRGSGWEDEEPRRRSVLTPVPGDTLRAALAELFTDHEVRVP